MASRYFIVLRGNTLDAMTEDVLHFAYLFLGRALAERQQQGKDEEYEAFALGVLALLQKYRHVYTTLPEAPGPNPAST